MGNTFKTTTSSSTSTSMDIQAKTLVTEAIAKYPVVIFSKSWCPYCVTAKQDIAIASKSVADMAAPKVYELDGMSSLGAHIQSYLAELTNRRTVPNVFIGGVTVGGGTEVNSIARSGVLKQMLAQASTRLNTQAKEVEQVDVGKHVESAIIQNPVVVFSKTYCGYCTRANAVLKQVGEGLEGYVQSEVFELDEMGDDGEKMQNYLFEKTGQRTVPNIFINGKHIGGCDDLLSTSNLPELLTSAYTKSSSSETSVTEGEETNGSNENIKEITIGAGCFWGVELEFQRVNGVLSTEVGYSNGKTGNLSYDAVCSGITGAAEVVRVTYDENVVSLKEILTIWEGRHDVTSLNQQGNDVGSQYRSAVFYTEEAQRDIIYGWSKGASDNYSGDIVTDIAEVDKYTRAEDYHQQYLEKKGQSSEKGETARIRCYG